MKVGDIVECVRDNNVENDAYGLKKGRTYIVAGLQGGHDSFIWVKDLEGHDIGIWRDGEGYHYDSRRFRIVKSNMCKSACLDCKDKCDFYESIDSTLVR